MAEASAFEVADYIIAFSHEHGDPVSNLKLQKLLYYAQAWHLTLFDKPLFDERIEAWVHGPVVPPVYREFKDWAWKPIDREPDLPLFSEDVSSHLEEVMDVYGGLTAYYLEKLTHQDGPWAKARGGMPPDEPSNAEITHDDMKACYRAALNHGQD